MDAIDWLLEDNAPGVQYLARLRLLGESPRSRRMTALRRRCNEYAPVVCMLDRVDDAIAAAPTGRYTAPPWTLVFLADMHADGRDRRVGRLVEHVLGVQRPDGGFTATGKPRDEWTCLHADVLRALVSFGYGKQEAVRRGYQRLADRILEHDGVPCMYVELGMHPTCRMAIPQTLRALAIAPPGLPQAKVKRLRDLLVKQLLEMRVYRYVRPDAKRFCELASKRPKGVTKRQFKVDYLKRYPERPGEWLPKKGWLTFKFPRSYNPDLLEAMLGLAELGVKHDPVLDDALDQIEKKRGKGGRWKLDVSLNGKMLANVERKGQASKWITLRALTVLKHFGRIKP